MNTLFDQDHDDRAARLLARGWTTQQVPARSGGTRALWIAPDGGIFSEEDALQHADAQSDRTD